MLNVLFLPTPTGRAAYGGDRGAALKPRFLRYSMNKPVLAVASGAGVVLVTAATIVQKFVWVPCLMVPAKAWIYLDSFPQGSAARPGTTWRCQFQTVFKPIRRSKKIKNKD